MKAFCARCRVAAFLFAIGYLDTAGRIGGAQIDRYANLNSTVIGPYDHPRVRLPGAGGLVVGIEAIGEALGHQAGGPRVEPDRYDLAHVDDERPQVVVLNKTDLLPEPPAAGRTVLEVDDLARSYGKLDIFDSVTFSVARGERLLVMGLNGAGKTSLLRILAGVAEPDLGTVHYGHQVDHGYYAQEHDLLDPSRSLIEQMRDHATIPDTEIRGLLGMFGLSGDIVFRPSGTLSGGEKTKLVLAQLVAGRHNLLFLDEPTNNLDPASREEVLGALRSYEGAIVLVTHDEGAVDALDPERILLLPDGVEDLWNPDYADLVALADVAAIGDDLDHRFLARQCGVWRHSLTICTMATGASSSLGLTCLYISCCVDWTNGTKRSNSSDRD